MLLLCGDLFGGVFGVGWWLAFDMPLAQHAQISRFATDKENDKSRKWRGILC